MVPKRKIKLGETIGNRRRAGGDTEKPVAGEDLAEDRDKVRDVWRRTPKVEPGKFWSVWVQHGERRGWGCLKSERKQQMACTSATIVTILASSLSDLRGQWRVLSRGVCFHTHLTRSFSLLCAEQIGGGGSSP